MWAFASAAILPVSGLSVLEPHACHCCGLIQQVPPLSPRERARCWRCHTPLHRRSPFRRQATLCLSLAALALYPAAMLLPMLGLERLGHYHEDSLLSGVLALGQDGYWFVATVVLLFSIVLPPIKLALLVVLCTRIAQPHHHHRALLYRMVEFLGRFGMLDVMLVAILVAFVKLGDLATLYPGSGLLAFTVMVLLSLFSGLCFDVRLLWEEPEP